MDPALIHGLTGLLVPLGGMVFLFAIGFLILDIRQRRDRQLHETVLRLAERGLPVPPELFKAQSSPRSRLQTAMTLVGLGVGLVVFFLVEGGDNWGIGAIPLCIGAAQLLALKFEGTKDAPSTTP